jgi:hypothetical protein
MFRNFLLFAILLGLLASTEALAAAAKRMPNRKILPGNHRPIYRRYGHHGMFHNGFLGFHNHRQTTLSGSKITKKHRGTL